MDLPAPGGAASSTMKGGAVSAASRARRCKSGRCSVSTSSSGKTARSAKPLTVSSISTRASSSRKHSQASVARVPPPASAAFALKPGRKQDERACIFEDDRLKLPNHIQAFVPQKKITHYLLDLTHPQGRPKARFFLGYGFRRDAWEAMAQYFQLHAATHEICENELTIHGLMFTVEGELETPDGRSPYVRTVWIIPHGETLPRFVTAYPGKAHEIHE